MITPDETKADLAYLDAGILTLRQQFDQGKALLKELEEARSQHPDIMDDTLKAHEAEARECMRELAVQLLDAIRVRALILSTRNAEPPQQ